MSAEACYRPDWHSSTIRGGVWLLTVSALIVPLSQNFEVRALDWLIWVSWLWLVFPTGAFLGGYLIPRLVRRPLPLAMFLGLCCGLLIGLGLTTCIVGMLNADGLIGLVTRTDSGGYASYRFAILKNLREMTWSFGKGVIPVLIFTILGWTFIKHRRAAKAVTTDTDETFPQRFQLSINGWHAVWWLGVAAIPALLSGMVSAAQQRGPEQAFLWILAGAGMSVTGPLMGPIINPNATNLFAAPALLTALPIITLSLLPFILKFSVTRSAAVIYWCIYITVILAWTGLGILSAGMSMG